MSLRLSGDELNGPGTSRRSGQASGRASIRSAYARACVRAWSGCGACVRACGGPRLRAWPLLLSCYGVLVCADLNFPCTCVCVLVLTEGTCGTHTGHTDRRTSQPSGSQEKYRITKLGTPYQAPYRAPPSPPKRPSTTRVRDYSRFVTYSHCQTTYRRPTDDRQSRVRGRTRRRARAGRCAMGPMCPSAPRAIAARAPRGRR